MDPTQRFSSRVADYVKYRPGYPEAIVDDLVAAGILNPASVIADIGSGTGLLTEIFLKRGHGVTGIEPNADMRHAGETQLRHFPRFISVDGRSEATTLAPNSIDLIIAGQAFHWFNLPPTRSEFLRILRPQGVVVLVWNQRLTDTTPFLRAYEDLLQQFSTDYLAVDHRNTTDEVIAGFYGPKGFQLRTYPNAQIFDFEGLRGRVLSSSYTPPAGHPSYEPMLAGLRRIYDEHQQNGQVGFEYKTMVYSGRLS